MSSTSAEPVAGSGRRMQHSFAVVGQVQESLAGLVEGLSLAFADAGFEATRDAADASLVLNLVDPAAPRPFRRRSKGTFVAALWSRPSLPEDDLRETYPMLVRALANISLCYVPG